MPFVESGNLRLHYVTHGSGPEPLVFLHGFTSSSRNWEPLYGRIPAAATAWFFDLRGAGQSDKPVEGYNPVAYAADIETATRALGLDTFTLIGHSMGGLTAMQFAVSYPGRLRRLVLVAPVGSNGLQNIPPEYHAISKSIRGNRALRLEMARATAPRPAPDAVILRRIEDDLLWPETAYDEAWEAMASVRLSDAVARLTMPVLMVAGDRDALLPANLEDARRIPNCGLQVFYRVGHEVAAEVPDAFMALIEDFVQHGVAAEAAADVRRRFLERAVAGEP